MNAVEAVRVNKSFNAARVVNDLSFTLEEGEILGMVGPNGAGKTTTIRMIMDIIKPDSGEIRVLGQTLNEDAKNRIGYLPEERGLYRKLRVSECLSYLAALKGVSPGASRARIQSLLTNFGMAQHQTKKVEELSRGMGQLIQFVAALVHDPALVILDEPFAGLDPVNTKLLKETILRLRSQGKAVILSTHRMNEVEELCDRVLMIDKGLAVLYGSLSQVKSRFRNNSIFFEGSPLPQQISGVVGRKDHGRYWELFLDGRTEPQQALNSLIEAGVRIDRFEVSTPSLNEIFIQVVEQGR